MAVARLTRRRSFPGAGGRAEVSSRWRCPEMSVGRWRPRLSSKNGTSPRCEEPRDRGSRQPPPCGCDVVGRPCGSTEAPGLPEPPGPPPDQTDHVRHAHDVRRTHRSPRRVRRPSGHPLTRRKNARHSSGRHPPLVRKTPLTRGKGPSLVKRPLTRGVSGPGPRSGPRPPPSAAATSPRCRGTTGPSRPDRPRSS